MLARDHALSGAAAFAVAAPLLHVDSWSLAAGVIFTAGAALVPDLDEPGSTLSREGGLATVALAHLVRKVSGGHRKLSHSFLGTVIFTAASWGAVQAAGHLHGHWPHLAALTFLWAFVECLLAAALHALRLARCHADLLAAVVATVALWQHWGLHAIPPCIALGCAAHLAGDMATLHGCPLLYPFSKRNWHLLPCGIRISTGKMAEHWIVAPLLLAALVFLLWWDAGPLAGHIHAAITARRTP
jgi:membrane-bound metal-dependent hydrolase YbcI (DUF457 family)